MSRSPWCCRGWFDTPNCGIPRPAITRTWPRRSPRTACTGRPGSSRWGVGGLTTVVMVLMLGQCRVLFAMSRDGLLPRQLATTGARGTPVRITVLVALLIAIAASVFPMAKLEEMVNVGTLFAFVLVSAGIVVLRRTRPDLHRGFRVPWAPLLPIMSVCACLWLMLNLTGLTWIRFGVWMVVGVAIYVGYGRRHSVLANRPPSDEASPEPEPTPVMP
ncbi:amino acid permease family protein [Mycobacterium xenopi 3993]|nr:amino acid permease family protein [Mycobacterium xenopi 3993]